MELASSQFQLGLSGGHGGGMGFGGVGGSSGVGDRIGGVGIGGGVGAGAGAGVGIEVGVGTGQQQFGDMDAQWLSSEQYADAWQSTMFRIFGSGNGNQEIGMSMGGNGMV